ncbi:MAG: hypothetical protein FWF81_08065 [Defluviitaleaceae bacterium]|nr:hypothetical protein [Defluviitaleaceae bacterium]
MSLWQMIAAEKMLKFLHNSLPKCEIGFDGSLCDQNTLDDCIPVKWLAKIIVLSMVAPMI